MIFHVRIGYNITREQGRGAECVKSRNDTDSNILGLRDTIEGTRIAKKQYQSI